MTTQRATPLTDRKGAGCPAGCGLRRGVGMLPYLPRWAVAAQTYQPSGSGMPGRQMCPRPLLRHTKPWPWDSARSLELRSIHPSVPQCNSHVPLSQLDRSSVTHPLNARLTSIYLAGGCCPLPSGVVSWERGAGTGSSLEQSSSNLQCLPMVTGDCNAVLSDSNWLYSTGLSLGVLSSGKDPVRERLGWVPFRPYL